MSQMTDHTDHDESEPCEGCALVPPRRAFFRDLGAAALGALLMAGIPAELAAAFEPREIHGVRRVGGDPSYPVPTADGVQIDKTNQVILVRWQNAVMAFNLSCPHQNTALRWTEGKGEFTCPKHKSRYQPDGTFIAGRATRNMDRFSLTHAGTEIVVHVDAMHKSDADQGGWASSVVKL
jgi:nitrite reductase/ring-hydroxylating ferredoxin subunit